jgi:predicted phosphoribosyltransferase
VAIPSAVFNSQVNDLLGRVRSAELRQTLANGGAYAVASRKFMRSLSQTPALKAQVLGVYVDSLKLVWQVGIAFGLLGFLIALVVKEIPMREQPETEFCMVDDGDRGSSESPGDVELAHEKQPNSAVSGK